MFPAVICPSARTITSTTNPLLSVTRRRGSSDIVSVWTRLSSSSNKLLRSVPVITNVSSREISNDFGSTTAPTTTSAARNSQYPRHRQFQQQLQQKSSARPIVASFSSVSTQQQKPQDTTAAAIEAAVAAAAAARVVVDRHQSLTALKAEVAAIMSLKDVNSDDVNEVVDDIEDLLHLNALQNQQKTYIDPTTGFTVFTELLHLKRGTCCGNACRHCPYGHEHVVMNNNTADTIPPPATKVQSGDFDETQRLYNGIMNNDEDIIQYLVSNDPTTKLTNSNNDTSNDEDDQDASEFKKSSPSSSTDTAPAAPATTTASSTTTTTTTTDKQKNVPYTRTGDKGTSQLLNGERRSKCDCNFEALGTVDELCSFVGVAHAQLIMNAAGAGSAGSTIGGTTTIDDNDNDERYGNLPMLLLEIMSRLFDIGSHVAKPKVLQSDHEDDHDIKQQFVSNGVGDGFDPCHINDLEQWINDMTDELPELTSFILPTGGVASAQLHVCRTTCRRAERRVVPLVVDDQTCDPNALRYLNRLSDFFFVAARWVNYCDNQTEIVYRRQSTNNTQRQRVHRSLNAQHEKQTA